MKLTIPLVATVAAACALGQTANGLKADVSFLASDALEGRATPSAGLTTASEFIAAGFRRAGLEPAGDDGYFQTGEFLQVTPSLQGFDLTVETGGKAIHASSAAVAMQQPGSVDLAHAPVWKTSANEVHGLTPDQVNAKVLVVEAGTSRGPLVLSPELHPALVIRLARRGNAGLVSRLREAGAPVSSPMLTVWDKDFVKALDAGKTTSSDATITAHIPAPIETAAKLRNVIGVLRGSDPALSDTYVVLSAHYDHLGIRGSGPGDRIFNGANDDASGTASVMEIALALAAKPERPKRSIVFITFFGEELGEVGSHYYVRHPVYPLSKTVADINLEQLGRTDDATGPHVGMFNLTGFDFTNLPETFRRAAAETGIRVVKDEANSDRYFTASDNAAFADAGVPATTVSVTYEFPDYHAVGDEWSKLDYANMAKVDQAVALAVYALADRAEAPQWNTAEPKTEGFRKARGKP